MIASKVTIGIPTLNRAGYLQMAVDAALAQTYANLEVVISNNASRDDTAKVLASITDPRVRVIHRNSTVSMLENWNICLGAATGTYFLMLSDDDLLEPEAVESLVAAIEQAPVPERVGFAYCRGRMIDADGALIGLGKTPPAVEDALALILAFFDSQRHTWACSILLRTADMRPGYSRQFTVVADAALWMKAVIHHGEARFVDRILVSYRVHQNLTVGTPIATWQQENLALGAFAIETLQAAGKSSPDSVQAIENAVTRLNARIIAGLLNGVYRRRRFAGIVQYFRYLPVFVSTHQMAFWFEGFLYFSIPAKIRRLLRPKKAAAQNDTGSGAT